MVIAFFINIYFTIKKCHWMMQFSIQDIFLIMEKSGTMLIKTVMTNCANIIGSLPYLLMKFFNFIKNFFLSSFFFSLIFFFRFRVFLRYIFFYIPFVVLNYHGISISFHSRICSPSFLCS